jgi:hypothetical protein
VIRKKRFHFSWIKQIIIQEESYARINIRLWHGGQYLRRHGEPQRTKLKF